MSLIPQRPRSIRSQRLVFAAALAFYLVGYPAVRYERLLVHTKSFVGSQDPGGPVVADHGIAPGDFGTPTLGFGTTLATLMASVMYWPVTHVEVLYWNLVEPPGSPKASSACLSCSRHDIGRDGARSAFFAIAPGAFKTDMMRHLEDDPTALSALTNQIPQKRQFLEFLQQEILRIPNIGKQ